MKLALKKPVAGIDGNEITEIEIKEPTGAMWLRHGDLEIARIERGGAAETVTIETNGKALMGYLEECTGLPAPILRSLHRKDLMAARAVLQGMFQEE